MKTSPTYGASHVEREWAEPGHVAAGASALAQVLRDLAFANQPFAAEALPPPFSLRTPQRNRNELGETTLNKT